MMKKLSIIDEKIISPEDKVSVSEKRVIGRPSIYNLKGELLANEENLVVLNGREFIAQKVLGYHSDLTDSVTNYKDYRVEYFGIGTGGTTGNPPSTVGPFDNDTELTQRVKISNTGVSTETNNYKYIDSGYLKRIRSDGSSNVVPETHEINTATGTEEVIKFTSIQYIMFIQETEPADKPVKFNEAGLYAVKYVNDKPTDEKILFARFTTLDKYLDLKDGLRIEWNILV